MHKDIFKRSKPTPNQIETLIANSKPEEPDLVESVIERLDPNVIDYLNDNFPPYKIGKFRKSIFDLINGKYKPLQISKLDIGCIKNNGKIDCNALDEILYDE